MLPKKPAQTRVYDISVLIQPGMPIYPGDPGISITQHQAITQSDMVNLSSISLGVHTGTHVDAPYHVDSKLPSLQDIDLTVMLGRATVFEMDVAQAITAKDLASLRWDDVVRVLFKTRNSRLWDGQFHQDFVYLADDATQFLTQHTHVRLVGIDYLSIERFGASQLSVHLELLGHGIVIVEGLNLSQVPAGEYQLLCLPLKLANPDGAPARAILIDHRPT